MSHEAEDFGHEDCDVCDEARRKERGPQWSDLMEAREQAKPYLKEALEFDSSSQSSDSSDIMKEFHRDKKAKGGFVKWCLTRALEILG